MIFANVTELTNTDDWSLTIMQTVLLCEYYARFRGRRKEAHEPSFLFSALYQLVSRFTCPSLC